MISNKSGLINGRGGSGEEGSLFSKRSNSSRINYDPMARANNFEFESELFTEEMLSEFDTEEAAALRALEDNIYDEICESENFEDWDDDGDDGYFDDKEIEVPMPTKSGEIGSYDPKRLLKKMALGANSQVQALISMEIGAFRTEARFS